MSPAKTSLSRPQNHQRTDTSVITMTHQEHRTANLKKANAARSKGAKLKQEIGACQTKEGLGIVAHVLVHDAEDYGFMTPLSLLSAVNSWGRTKAVQHCRRCEISEVARLDELSDEDRAMLATRFLEPDEPEEKPKPLSRFTRVCQTCHKRLPPGTPLAWKNCDECRRAK